jgi:alkylation response protein AidB-like acyl-CoA dehydrogenase
VLDAAWRQTERRPAADAAAAIAWLAAIRTSLMIEEHCHQAFGSLGLCNETGLVRFTWGMAWLRLSIGKKTAQRFLASHGQFSRETPSHRVLEAFRHDPDATRSAQLREAVAKE